MNGEPRPYAVVDLDGTVADVRHRLHHLRGSPGDRQWAAFFAAAPGDGTLDEGVAAVRLLDREHNIVWLTGRPERCRRDTEGWLARHDLPAGVLLMRRDGDRRPARVVKVALLRKLARRGPVAVLVDDDEDVVSAARKAGFPVLHATWMDELDGPGERGGPPARELLRRAQEAQDQRRS